MIFTESKNASVINPARFEKKLAGFEVTHFRIKKLLNLNHNSTSKRFGCLTTNFYVKTIVFSHRLHGFTRIKTPHYSK